VRGRRQARRGRSETTKISPYIGQDIKEKEGFFEETLSEK
jgi:hypothetical protein